MNFRYHPAAVAVVLAFSTLGSSPAKAQTRPAPVLDDVVVRASKIELVPASAVVGSRMLEALRPATSDTASLLREIPGVSLQSAGGASSLPVVHGMADDRLKILVDGMDFVASCPNHMNPPLSYVDPSQIGKLKVYAGISPVSVGGDSIGGTILAETAPPLFASAGQEVLVAGQLGTFYRSNGDGVGINASATAATGTVSLHYTGAWAKADDYRAGGDFRDYRATGNGSRKIDRRVVGSSAFETRTHAVGLAVRGGDHLLEAKVGYQDVPEQLYPNQRMDMLDNEQKRFNLRYLGQMAWGALEVRAYHERVAHEMDFGEDKRYWYGARSSGGMAACSPLDATCAAGMPMYTRSTTTGFSGKADVDLDEANLLRVGGLYHRYRLDDWWPASGGGMWPGTFENIDDGRRDRGALFAEWESRFAPQWLSLLGVRYEHVKMDAGDVRGYDPTIDSRGMGMMVMWNNQRTDAAVFNAREHARSDDNWDATAILRHTPSETLDVEVGLARKVRSPNLYERYTWSTWGMAAVMNNFAGDGNGYVGNLDLKPEKAHTAALTLDWHSADRRVELRATPYYTHVDDYIDAIRCPVNNRTCSAANTNASNQFVLLQYTNQSARIFGIDVSGRTPLASTAIGAFDLRGMVAYTHGTNRDTGDELYNVMPFNARLTLGHQLGAWDNAIEFVGASGKKHVSDVRNEIPTAGYGLINLRASHTWSQVRLDVGVENLFDKLYFPAQGGAYVGQGTTMSTNGIPWGIGVPGRGRSVYAGVNVKF